MDPRQIIYLGVALTGGSILVFVVSWSLLGYGKLRSMVGIERLWFRSLVVSFYVGLAVLLCDALASLIGGLLSTVKGSH